MGVPARPRIHRSALPMLALVLAPVLVLTLGFVWNEDLWWYLANGEHILDEGSVPEHDPFLAESEKPLRFPSHSWLFTVVTALVHRGLGLYGIAILAMLLAGALVVLLFGSARVDRHGIANAFFTGLVMVSAAERFSGKSEMVSWLFLAIFFYLLDRDTPFSPKSLAALVILQLLWANLHAGYPLGFAIVLAYTVGGWARRLLERRRQIPAADRSPAPPLWLLPALVGVALLAPEGSDRLGMLRITAEVTTTGLSGEELGVDIDELLPTFESPDPSFGQLYLVALTAAGLALASNRRSRRFLPRLCFLAGMAVLAYTAIRHVTGLTCAAALVGLTSMGERKLAESSRGERSPGVFYKTATAAVMLFLAAASGGLWLLRSDLEVGQSRDRIFTLNPLASSPGAADYVLTNGLPPPLFNDQSLGGYLIHRLYPSYRPFVDNRIWSRRRIDEYTEISLSPERWREAEREHGFRTAVLTNLRVPSSVPLRSHLAADPAWRLVYADPTAVVFVRGQAAGEREYHFAGDTEDGLPFLTPEKGFGAWLRQCGGLFFRPDPEALLHQYLSVLGRLRRYAEVDRQATAALELRPSDPQVYRDRGSARMLLGRRQEGVDDLRAAVRLAPSDPWSHYTLALAQRDLGRLDEAAESIERALRLDPGNARFVNVQRQIAAGLHRRGSRGPS